MKITPKQYAQALHESIKDKDKSQVEKIIKNFVGVLIENNGINKKDKIIEEFNKLWNKENNIVEVLVVSAKKISEEINSLLNNYIAKLTASKNVILNNKIDKDILSGVVLKYEDKILDGSFKNQLNGLKKQMKS